ncbi:MAG: LOG family protein [Pseudomonadota bacterium]|nr:LOG family protein [Pseudomonadota bacterium]
MSAPVMRTMRPCIAIVGDARVAHDHPRWKLAEAIGRGLVDAGYRVVTGGMGGVMEAAHRGARSSSNWFDGAGIGILPGSDISQANAYVDIAIPTGLDHARNAIVAHSAAVIAIGGGAGTLSEMALAWTYRRLVIGLLCGGSSELLAGGRVDERERYPEILDDQVFAADSASQALALLQRWLPAYNKVHAKITAAPSDGKI